MTTIDLVEGDNELRVVLVDDHEMFRTTLRELLESSGRVRVAGEAANGEQAILLARDEAPDVVVMDLAMPGIGGAEATRRIVAESPHSRVVVLTVSADEKDLLDAILAGAVGYLLKSATVDELIQGIETAARGDVLISPAIAGHLLGWVRSDRPAVPTLPESDHLSPREHEVLRLVAEGLDNAAIAQALGISPKTARNHVSNILMKLQMSNRIQAAVYAVRRGLV